MLRPARLAPGDLFRVGATGLRTRPMRAVLSALGIAIGIAAMIAVVGISTSSRAELDETLSRLGTNLLRVEPGEDALGSETRLPVESVSMVRRIAPVTGAASVGLVPDARALRNDHVPPLEHGGVTVSAADEELYGTVGLTMSSGRWLSAATDGLPVVVLGAKAAEHLGVTGPDPQTVVIIEGQPFSVSGVLDPVELAPELDSSVLMGKQVASERLGWTGDPSRIYVRTVDSAVDPVRDVLGATANPAAPNQVAVSRPSDALAAKEATDAAFTGLLVGLGAVALLVGGIGVANTMVISVLERRSEIGLRRSLGATRGQVRTQFLVESLLLSVLGGGAGVVIGYGITAVYATSQGWATSIPPVILAGGLGATLLIGAVAGLYPAIRAARMPPTAALSAS
ncbi:ABC-type antimicrobial peptide transport system, permease component [Sanguibacter keddieii DSM 10542]|uniref:ABC-type antimicrobial peptide transport system, permease component n=1 Tax=Sanguibacter keddieii (strain ATCC 51767 / DSM 10542 / NCFB 3025 / ST-74) TaxID=446469 RepID=D1BK23_SANKS|nr:ABC transporter permease [Sanguibacter keddieii]ACZ22432.1 ABC-type antimicrobial peptide transport system, permease component [Sanguibacter keddieii DSM 10542]